MPTARFDQARRGRPRTRGFSGRVRRCLSSDSELKYVSVVLGSLNLKTPVTLLPVFLIEEGLNRQQRVGNRIMLRRIRLRVLYNNTNGSQYRVRHMVYRNKGDQLVVDPLGGNLLGLANPDRFLIKKDNISNVTAVTGSQSQGFFSYEKMMNQVVQYDGPSGLDVVQGMWYLYSTSSAGADVNSVFGTYHLEAWYHDL